MRKIWLLTIGALMALATSAQDKAKFEFRSGYGSFAMNQFGDELHYNERVIAPLLPARVVNDFPSWYTFGVTAMLSYERFDSGLAYTFHSTAGRVHYKDYSGEVGLEYLMKMQSIGMAQLYHFLEGRKLDPYLAATISVNFSDITVRSWSRVDDDEDLVQEFFFSRSVGISLMPGVQYPVTKWMYLGARAGFFVDVKGQARWTNDKNVKLIDHTDKDMKTDWGGWRAEAYIGFQLDLSRLSE